MNTGSQTSHGITSWLLSVAASSYVCSSPFNLTDTHPVKESGELFILIVNNYGFGLWYRFILNILKYNVMYVVYQICISMCVIFFY